MFEVNEEILKLNLAALRIRNPLLAGQIEDIQPRDVPCDIVETKDGYPTAVWQHMNGERVVKTTLHSRYAPLKEAQRFSQGQYHAEDMVLYGFGLGYHVVGLFELLHPEQTLTVFEASRELLLVAFSLFDLTEMLSSEQFILESGVDSPSLILKIAQHKDNGLIVHAPSVHCIGDAGNHLKIELHSYLLGTSTEERRSLSVENYHANMKLGLENISVLFGTCTGKTAYIVASGPSLEKNGHLLATAGPDDVVIAASSALRPLLTLGVTPEFVVIMDPLHFIEAHFDGVDMAGTALVGACFSSNQAFKKYDGDKYIYFNEPVMGISEEQVLETGGSVATAAFSMALKFGCRRIVFVGQDLSHSGGMHHASGAGHHERVKVAHWKSDIRFKDINGQWVSTRPNLLNYKRWFEQQVKSCGDVEILNATEGGLPIEGVRNVPLAELLPG